MHTGFRRMAFLLIAVFVISILPMNLVPEWNKTTRVVHAAGTLTREDFKKFEGMIVSGSDFTAILNDDGTVQKTTISGGPQDFKLNAWNDIISISAGDYHLAGLKSDGTVITAGDNRYGQLNVGAWNNIAAVSSGAAHTVGLRKDGTVVAVGDNSSKQCDVQGWQDIIAISARGNITIGLKSDGTLVGTGDNNFDQLNFQDWNDIIAVSAGDNHTVGLKSDGTVVATGYIGNNMLAVQQWTNIAAISASSNTTVGLKNDGTLIAVGSNADGQCNVGAWKNIVAISTSGMNTIGLKSDGTVVGVGYNGWGQLNFANWDASTHYININSAKSIIKPNESVSIFVSKFNEDKFIKLSGNPEISLSGGAALSRTPMSVNDNGYEYTYTANNEDSGQVTVSIYGIVDIFGNDLVNQYYFKVIPLKSITASQYNVKPGDKINLVATFFKGVKRDFKIALSGSVQLDDTSVTEVAGSNGTKYILSYQVPYDSNIGDANVSLKNVSLYDGTVFESYTESSVFVKQNTALPINSILVSKTQGKLNDTIDIDVEFSEAIQPGLQIQFSGASNKRGDLMEVAGSNGTKYKYTYNVESGENGSVSLKITNAYDSGGNLCLEYTKDNVFSVDGIVPTVVVTSSSQIAKLNDIIRINASFSEAVENNIHISILCGTNLEDAAMLEVQGSGGTEYYYDYAVKQGYEGNVNVSLSDISDLAGNTTTLASKSLFAADGNPAKLNSISSDFKKYFSGDFIHIIASLSEPVNPNIKIKFTGAIDNEEYAMAEVPGSNRTQYEIYYEVKEGQVGPVNAELTNVEDLAGNISILPEENIFYINYALWDVNNDGNTDILDVAGAAKFYNVKSSQSSFRQEFDLNKDNRIDIFDLVLISKNIK